MLSREVQPSNALSPILVTLSGISMLSSAVQFENKLRAIFEMPLGSVMPESEVQPSNA